MDPIENDEESLAPEIFNPQFVNAIDQAADGHCKNASASTSKMIRRKLRENGFLRLVIDPVPITDADLDRALETDLPRMIEDMEPDSPGAVVLPFDDSPDTSPYRGDRFEIVFCKISTREYTKNRDQLRTYRMDLRQVITDNSLRDMHTCEDATFVKLSDRVVGPASGLGLSGVQQNFEIAGQITRQTYKDTKNHLEDLQLNNGVYVLNRHTANEFLGWNHDEEGGPIAAEVAQKGHKAWAKFERFGIPHIATIKRDLVPDNVVYQFTEPNFLGRFYVLEDITMFIERRKDIIRMSAQEKIGVAIANVKGICRTKFTG